jgi:hypothetical protein
MSYDELTYLARAYFHQDFDLTADSPLGVVRHFVARETAETVAALADELDAILRERRGEQAVRELWLTAGQASYDPARDGLSCLAWFERIRAVL